MLGWRAPYVASATVAGGDKADPETSLVKSLTTFRRMLSETRVTGAWPLTMLWKAPLVMSDTELLSSLPSLVVAFLAVTANLDAARTKLFRLLDEKPDRS